MPAYEFLQTVPHDELVRIIDEFGEETMGFGGAAPRRIADAICLARARGTLPKTTKAFSELVTQVSDAWWGSPKTYVCMRFCGLSVGFCP